MKEKNHHIPVMSCGLSVVGYVTSGRIASPKNHTESLLSAINV